MSLGPRRPSICLMLLRFGLKLNAVSNSRGVSVPVPAHCRATDAAEEATT